MHLVIFSNCIIHIIIHGTTIRGIKWTYVGIRAYPSQETHQNIINFCCFHFIVCCILSCNFISFLRCLMGVESWLWNWIICVNYHNAGYSFVIFCWLPLSLSIIFAIMSVSQRVWTFVDCIIFFTTTSILILFTSCQINP